MKKDEKIEYSRTTEGKKLFKMYIIGHILLVLMVVGLLYVIFNEGNVLTGTISGIVIASSFCALCGAFLIGSYLFTMQAYNKNKK